MGTPLPFSKAVPIGPDAAGRDRGRLSKTAAASLRRVDAALGRPLDVNEAWRSPAQADKNFAAYKAWLAYQNGTGPRVPWAPIALPADQSVHCEGDALDTDEGQPIGSKVDKLLVEHGWILTVYRWEKDPKTGRYRYVLKEAWHREHFPEKDKHRNDPEPVPAKITKDEDMAHVASEHTKNQFAIFETTVTVAKTTADKRIFDATYGKPVELKSGSVNRLLDQCEARAKADGKTAAAAIVRALREAE